ncbi:MULTISPECIES: hypothetical protein [Idiomarina]|uniref:hypothetical protein n=1 Tax=Idiomarina TaxID=135575 RepID=UPI00129A5809|nr:MULTISPECIES: hypothetical protein [Idiomarina]MRJ40801.1 hypothetical protein [Idiomarina sp. FeN1]NCU56605.1 hypothetical protein [Idiomarina sp. FenA--70]NCU58985.1 hypothetical protein [Idiomarina sp. FenBw--71]UUN14518.1 hypothetical protein KGF88_04705 [Idiomarina loihiensis]
MNNDICAVYVSYQVLTKSGELVTVNHQLQLDASTGDELRQHVASAVGEVTISARQPEWNFM